MLGQGGGAASLRPGIPAKWNGEFVTAGSEVS